MKVKTSLATPACFNSVGEFKLWVAAARQSPPNAAHSYCEDCTSSYRDKMILQQRCAHPNTTFRIFNGELVGRRPQEFVKKLRMEAMLGIKPEVENA